MIFRPALRPQLLPAEHANKLESPRTVHTAAKLEKEIPEFVKFEFMLTRLSKYVTLYSY